MKTPHVIFLSFFFDRSIKDGMSQWTSCDLHLWPMTYKFDLDFLALDLHAKIQVHTSVRSAGIVRQTGRRTYRRCQNYYTRHVTDVECKYGNCLVIIIFCHISSVYSYFLAPGMHRKCGSHRGYPHPGLLRDGSRLDNDTQITARIICSLHM